MNAAPNDRTLISRFKHNLGRVLNIQQKINTFNEKNQRALQLLQTQCHQTLHDLASCQYLVQAEPQKDQDEGVARLSSLLDDIHYQQKQCAALRSDDSVPSDFAVSDFVHDSMFMVEDAVNDVVTAIHEHKVAKTLT